MLMESERISTTCKYMHSVHPSFLQDNKFHQLLKWSKLCPKHRRTSPSLVINHTINSDDNTKHSWQGSVLTNHHDPNLINLITNTHCLITTHCVFTTKSQNTKNILTYFDQSCQSQKFYLPQLFNTTALLSELITNAQAIQWLWFTKDNVTKLVISA